MWRRFIKSEEACFTFQGFIFLLSTIRPWKSVWELGAFLLCLKKHTRDYVGVVWVQHDLLSPSLYTERWKVLLRYCSTAHKSETALWEYKRTVKCLSWSRESQGFRATSSWGVDGGGRGGINSCTPPLLTPPNLPFRHCLSCGTRSVMTLSLRACNAVLCRLRMKSRSGIEWQFNQRPFQHMPRICFSSNCCTSPGLQGDDRSCWGSGRVGTLCFQRALDERATEPWSAGGEWKRAFECFPPSVVQCIDYEERFPKTMTVGHLWRTSCRALPYFLCGSASVQNIKGRVDF